MIQPDDIILAFVDANGIPGEPEGYHFADFFRGGLDWTQQTYPDAAHAFAAAQADYLGSDIDGIGVRVTVFDGEARIVRRLVGGTA